DSGPIDSGPNDSGPIDAGQIDSGANDSGPGDAGALDAGCFAPRDADADRTVVVSHPYLPDAGDDTRYELLELTSAGALTDTGRSFSMRRSTEGKIVFTPDGRFGFAPQDDGTTGVFELFADGGVQVLDDGFGSYY